RYVGGPPESRGPRVGGTVEYGRAPGGAWIVRRWAIRMPLVREAVGGSVASMSVTNTPASVRVLSLRESGGEVTGTYGGTARLAASTPPIVEGVVWDSTRNAPLAGARVYLSGTQAEAVADGDGRYRLAAPAEGTYTLAFAHPDMGPLVAPPREVTLRAGAVDTANLAIPGWSTLAPALCPDSTLHPHRGIIVGRVRGYAPGDTSLVSATSSRRVIGGAGVYAGTQFVATRPDADGFYVLCGVPENRPLQLGMRLRGIDEGGTEITLRSGVPTRADISADPRAMETGMDAALSGAMGMPARQGPQRAGALEGFERRRRGGRGIFLSRADVERRHAARLEDLFRGIPGLQVVGEGAGGRVVFPGSRSAPPGGEMRRAAPLGDRPRDGRETRDARDVGGARESAAPASDANACAVQFYLDGVYTPTEDGRISDRVRLEEVEAVEVYRGPSELPPEFRRSGADCGVIVVWTRRAAAAAHP
ncbi:MAG: carboxypeptidase regulatory-like domain-containing protein, partial [Gemmatimonadetes bacterium]|nr:carboxypeptidase regulatory-like domain-containing protein [Gemmatimonadota bacterium]